MLAIGLAGELQRAAVRSNLLGEASEVVMTPRSPVQRIQLLKLRISK